MHTMYTCTETILLKFRLISLCHEQENGENRHSVCQILFKHGVSVFRNVVK